MADLFQRIEDRKDDYSAQVIVTFLEIYNEEIRDLLSEPGTPTPRGGLQIREDKSVKVVGLTELQPRSADEVKEIVLLGNSRRTQSPTHANETSSRSHAVLQVHVTQAPRTASLTEERSMGTLSIIDLAGSERAAATSNMGQRMVEGANINKSLLALGNCINALCESGGVVRHIPYRNSKLTRLLKFSLGGNCKTVMIVCVAPTSIHFDDTHNTLIYAERATKIKTRVVTRNVVNVDRHVGQYVEAINRLNIEVSELKAKLAGKLNSEADVARRKRIEAQAEIERAKNDMQVRAEQTQASILDGATCAGKITAAQITLRTIRARLDDLDRQALLPGGLSPDLQAEMGLLKALAAPEEQATRIDSALNVRLQRSTNSGSMFDAMLRAVKERRSDRLDATGVDNVKLDAECRKAEMERVKAEAERDAVKDAMKTQGEMLVHLLGMVGRYTVVIGDASRSLRTALEVGRDGLDGTIRALAASLKNLSDSNDMDFQSLVGHAIASYAVSPGDMSMLESFKGHKLIGRASSGPILPQQPAVPISRRASSYGALGMGSPARKGHIRSPRKSLRNSLSGANFPYRRPADKGKEKKKGVQWKDEAGQGELDDGGEAKPASAAIPSSSKFPVPVKPSPDDSGLFSAAQRNPGSESEWEDEKTEDSVNFSFTLPPRDLPPSRAGPSRIRRSSRLEPSFLTSRGASKLGSLAEDDENGEVSSAASRHTVPLSDRSLNSLLSNQSMDSAETISAGGKLHVPKGAYERNTMASPRRGPPTPRAVGSTLKSSRRRSNIGPMRSEKGRRRSSLIPQLSPKSREGTSATSSSKAPTSASAGPPRRVAMAEMDPSVRKSPGKKGKRMSLLNMASKGMSSISSARLRPSPSASMANISVGDISAADTSFKVRPTWK